MSQSCSGSLSWARRVAFARPLGSGLSLVARGEAEWEKLTGEEVLESAASHPRIGADLDALRRKYGSGSFSEGEQAGVAPASENVLLALREGNLAYEKRFGHIFIVCASGKTAAEMLEILQTRMQNEPDVELVVTKGELWKITRLRLEKA